MKNPKVGMKVSGKKEWNDLCRSTGRTFPRGEIVKVRKRRGSKPLVKVKVESFVNIDAGWLRKA